MTEISLVNQALTMTSQEIAYLVKSRHDNVKVTIDRLAERGVIAIPAPQEYLDVAGRGGQVEYLVTKRDSYIVVAQLSPEFTAAIVDRWQALEIIVQEQAQDLLATTQAQLKLAHKDSGRWQDKVIYLEAEQATRSYQLDAIRLGSAKQSKAQLKNSEVHVKNLGRTVHSLLERVSDLENSNKDLKEALADALHQIRRVKCC